MYRLLCAVNRVGRGNGSRRCLGETWKDSAFCFAGPSNSSPSFFEVKRGRKELFALPVAGWCATFWITFKSSLGQPRELVMLLMKTCSRAHAGSFVPVSPQ
eukprot:TRINITY_DN4893_c0_g1_i1.p1 TRINITY_DN4893_c0_g1~~TRINITY_DN4893_c0_g1_i1.p1  ORF type:complete len:101 (-),score=3.11 TRINITY_DN4893_c0_g1_i1:47-349(-)